MSGIIDFDVRLPSGIARVADMHAASGLPTADIMAITHCAEFPVLADGEQAWELAARAGRTILARSGITPESIGKVIYTGSGEWDIPFWSPAAKVADELGIRGAHCFEVTNFCNGFTVALRLAMDEIQLARSENVLLLIGDRLSRLVDYADPDSKVVFNFGDAPAAVLLGRDGYVFHFLHSAMHTDPSWCDYYSGEHEEFQVYMRRHGRRTGLRQAYLKYYSELVAETLSAIGRKTSDIRYFLINHSDESIHVELLKALGIPAEKTLFNYGQLGHMGGSDVVVGLRQLISGERLRAGDLVLLATSGMGFSWGITALEYRPGQ